METVKQQLINGLKSLMERLENTGRYEPLEFRLWGTSEVEKILPQSDIVKIVKGAYSEGFCQSETCSHNSHSPYTEGDMVFILAKRIGEIASGLSGTDLYESKSGVLFSYGVERGYSEHHLRRYLIKKEGPEVLARLSA